MNVRPARHFSLPVMAIILAVSFSLIFPALHLIAAPPAPDQIKPAAEDTKKDKTKKDKTKKEEKKKDTKKKSDKTEGDEEDIPEGTVFDNAYIEKMKNSEEKYNITTYQPAKKKAKNVDTNTAPPAGKDGKPAVAPAKPKNDPKKTEAYWKERKRKLVNNIEELEGKIKDMEARRAYLNTLYLHTDTPMEQMKIKEESNKLYEALEHHKRGLARLKQELQDLSTEARKMGIPPGWLRD